MRDVMQRDACRHAVVGHSAHRGDEYIAGLADSSLHRYHDTSMA